MNTKDKKTNKSQNLIGTVIAMHMEKTVKVEVGYVKKHPLYKKALKRTRSFACHNEVSGIEVGDKVEICQIRPMSKTKHFSIVKKI